MDDNEFEWNHPQVIIYHAVQFPPLSSVPNEPAVTLQGFLISEEMFLNEDVSQLGLGLVKIPCTDLSSWSEGKTMNSPEQINACGDRETLKW